MNFLDKVGATRLWAHVVNLVNITKQEINTNLTNNYETKGSAADALENAKAHTNTEIGKLDGAVSGSGNFVKTISQTNGKITAGLGNITINDIPFHASTKMTFGVGDNKEYGHVKLSDAYNSTSGELDAVAATPYAVKVAYDKGANAASAAGTAQTKANEAYTLASGKLGKNEKAVDSAKADTAGDAAKLGGQLPSYYATATALNTVSNKTDTNKSAIEANTASIKILNGVTATDTTGDTGKSVRTIAQEETAKIVNNAPAAYDTLKEIADWISNDTSGAASIASNLLDARKEIYGTTDGSGTTDDSTSRIDINASNIGTINSTIQGMKVEDSAVDKKFVTAVSQTDGKITVSRESLKDTDLPRHAQSAETIDTNMIPFEDEALSGQTLDEVLLKIETALIGNESNINTVSAKVIANETNITNITNGTTKVKKAKSADSATKATNDSANNKIVDTYATKTELTSGYITKKDFTTTTDEINTAISEINGAIKDVDDKILDIESGSIKAAIATKATQDGNGNNIVNTYATKTYVESEAGTAETNANTHTDNKLAALKYAGSESVGGAAKSVKASITFNNSGSGVASGTTYNGSAARTVSYNSIGAAPTSHAASSATYGASSDTNYGHVRLSDAINSTSSTAGGYAATPNAVKLAIDAANNAISTLTNNIEKTYTKLENVNITPAKMIYDSTNECINFIFGE